ncbi:hypothetical protein BDY24DRAFT_440454 [Mrakia frigida]|uniref:uncharacterized protein n=1 Tax=Mrakia frigida TaxID=29902 RepID=UPI003FCC0155
MVVDLLQRRGGIFLVGDSITSQHLEGLSHLLMGLAITESKRLNVTSDAWTRPLFNSRNITEANIPETDGLDLPWFRGLFLRVQHPLTKMLLEEAGVGEERLLLPVATSVRDDFLMSREEYEEFLERDEFSLEEGVDFATTEWIRYIERVTSGGEGTPSKPAVLVLSTGPHWANGRFAGAGQTKELKPERLLGMYERSIKSLFQRLEPIESVIPIFRTTAQGTPSCWIYSKENSHPANATQLLTIKESFFPPPGAETKYIYNWPLIPTFNNILQNEVESFNYLRRRKNGREAVWMDVAGQALTRPDAHLSPMAGDCLHVCMPGLPEEWVRFTWELIKAESVVY